MNVFPALLVACIDRLGADSTIQSYYCNPQQYQRQVPGCIKNVYFVQTPPLTAPVHFNNGSKPESFKAALNE